MDQKQPVIAVFKLLGRRKPNRHVEGKGQCKLDLLIEPMMEVSDEIQQENLHAPLESQKQALQQG